MNRLLLQYKKGFNLIFKDKKGRNVYFLPDSIYCCEDFNFNMIGLKISTLHAFVLKEILDRKKGKSDRGVWEEIDLQKNYCCFLETGNIPYTGGNFLVVLSASGDMPTEYPIALFDVNGDLIEYVNNKTELIDAWNNAPAHQSVGTIEDIGENFIFKFNAI